MGRSVWSGAPGWQAGCFAGPAEDAVAESGEAEVWGGVRMFFDKFFFGGIPKASRTAFASDAQIFWLDHIATFLNRGRRGPPACPMTTRRPQHYTNDQTANPTL